MWIQTVATQLSRPSTGTTLDARLNMLSAFFGSPALDDAIPWVAWAVAVGRSVGARSGSARRRSARAAIAGGVVRSRVVGSHRRDARDRARVFGGVLRSLRDLADRAAGSHDRRRPSSDCAAVAIRRAIGVGAVALMIVVTAPQLVPRPQTRDYADLRVAAEEYGCAWGSSDVLAVADALSRGVSCALSCLCGPVWRGTCGRRRRQRTRELRRKHP